MAGPAPLAVDVTIDSTTFAALALVLTLLGAAATVLAWRRRGPAPALRALAWTLVPVALWLTGTLRLVVAVVEDVATWASRLVFSPTVWAGLAVAAVAVVLFWVSGRMLARGVGVRAVTGRADASVRSDRTGRGRGGREVGAAGTEGGRPGRSARTAGATSAGRGGAPAEDDDMADIEAILRKHGI